MVPEKCRSKMRRAGGIVDGVEMALESGWIKQLHAEPETAFPGSGNLKPEEDEIRRNCPGIIRTCQRHEKCFNDNGYMVNPNHLQQSTKVFIKQQNPLHIEFSQNDILTDKVKTKIISPEVVIPLKKMTIDFKTYFYNSVFVIVLENI